MKYIKKVSVAPIGSITGSIVDTTNIDDKSSNTYSANVIDGLTNIETVTNTNGKAIKFPNGTMICIKTVSLDDVPINSSIGNMYQSGDRELGNFAVSFIESMPIVNVSVRSVNSLGWVGYHAGVSESSAGKIRINRPTANDSNSYIVSVTAYGTWK